MILWAVLLGLCLGGALTWASDYLVRASRKDASAPALWQLGRRALSRGRNEAPSPALWLNAAQEVLTTSITVYLWARLGPTWPMLRLLALCALFLLIALIDAKYRVIPNIITYPALALALIGQAIPTGQQTLLALIGCAVGLVPFLLVFVLKPGDLGGGDVKLGALIGLALGFPQVLWAQIVGISAGALTAIALLLTRRWSTKSHMPYGPFLCLGAIIALLFPLPFVLPT